MIDVATLLSSQPEPEGRRVAVLTNAGGLGILCADACDASGLELPELSEETREILAALLSTEASFTNPVDMLGGATPQTYADALRPLLRDPHVDAVITLFVPTVTALADDVAQAIDEVAAAEATGKPVLAVVMTAEGVPRSSVVARATSPRSPIRSPRPVRWAELPNGRIGFADRME